MIVNDTSNAPHALSLLSLRPAGAPDFAFALVDWNLPVIDGPKFARLLRGQRNKGQTTKVILLSAVRSADHLAQAKDAGVDDILLKPLRQRQLLRCLLQAGRPKAAVSPSPNPSPAIETSAISILLVEDNPVNQQVALHSLRKLGYAVQIAADGFAAVSAFSQGRFDLILMDCHMPGMDGMAATRKIRELGGAGRTIPILALTADVFQTERDCCLASGMNDFLSKPIRSEILKSKIEYWLRKSPIPT
jgi:CheY-like chemotaxis protein